MTKTATKALATLKDDNTEQSTVQTLVLVADEDLGGVIAYLLAGAPNPDELAKMMAEGVFGDSAIDIMGSTSGPADDFAEMLTGGFSETMMEGLGFDLGALGTAIEDLGMTPPSSEDAFEKALADKKGHAMQDDDGVIPNDVQGAVGATLLVVGGALLWTPEPTGTTKLVGGVLMLIGAAVAGEAAADEVDDEVIQPLKKGLETSSNDTNTDDAKDGDDKEDQATAVASADTDDKNDDDKPDVEETATTMPQDPNVDGTGGGDGDLPEDDDPTGGAGDPEEDDEVFVFVNVEVIADDDINTLILTDPDKFYAELPPIDPFQLQETTQPGSPDDDQFVADSFSFG